MKRGTPEFYRAGEFAELAGVTVRALHHYDELDLLKPTAHSQSGYRLYTNGDLARLSQISALRFIGMPLKEIKAVLAGENLCLASALEIQREIMTKKRLQLEKAVRAIERAQAAFANEEAGAWAALREVIQSMKEQESWEWAKKHYTPEQLERLSKRYDPAMQETWSNQWSALIADVDAAKGVDPASPVAQALAKRWSDLIGQFTGGDPDIERSLKNVYAESAAQASGFKNPLAGQAGEFISKAMAILRERP